MNTYFLLLRASMLGLLLLSGTWLQAAIITSDGDFVGWFSTFTTTGSGTHTATVESTGGNPGARYLSDIHDLGSVVRTANIKTDFSTTAALAGDSYILRIDALEGPPAIDGFQNVALVVRQGSSIWYGADIGINAGATWANYSVTNSFNSANFTAMVGSGSPDFNGGVTTEFGFYTTQQQGGVHYAQYYDNWSLDVVPEPVNVALGIFGVLLGGVQSFRWWNARRAKLSLS